MSTDDRGAATKRAAASSPDKPKSILKDSPHRAKRAAMGSAAAGSAAIVPVKLDIGSPPPQRQGGALAPAAPVGVPPENCSTEQLRLFVLSQFASVAKDVQELENQLVAQTHDADKKLEEVRARVAPLDALQHDVNVFEGVRQDQGGRRETGATEDHL